jgi:hypothetical protein
MGKERQGEISGGVEELSEPLERRPQDLLL